MTRIAVALSALCLALVPSSTALAQRGGANAADSIKYKYPSTPKLEALKAEAAKEIHATYAGRTVLVVGHSNTVPAIVAALSGRTIDPIPDDRYGDVYVVVMPKTGAPRLMQMRVQ